MKHLLLLFVGWFLMLTLPHRALSQQDYPGHGQLSERAQQLALDNQRLVRLESLTKTAGGKDIWLLSVGAGDLSQRPAIAIVGGVPGNHLLGPEVALQFAEKLVADAANNPEIRALLDSVTFYVFPDMSPDAREQYFAPLRYERTGNAGVSDLDRDGLAGEDPYDDLNGDRLITMMRINDPTGNWMMHPEDERIMVKARPEKGDTGTHYLFSEGIDQDQDGQYNEDGEEGVFFNRNFTFKYPAFTRGAGEHAISEPETRAIADFLFSAKNVFAVISFGSANNLSEPLKYHDREAAGRIPTGWQEKDIVVNQMVSLLYNASMKDDQADAGNENPGNTDPAQAETGHGNDSPDEAGPDIILTGGKGVPGSDGDFFQWAYFHYGRFSFSTPGWWVPAPDSQTGSAARQQRQQPENIESDELKFIRWAEKYGLTGVFVPWTEVDHPDFPGKKVEVGGITPFMMKNPPYTLTDVIAEKHKQFVLDIARKRPQTDIVNLKTESLGNNLFRVTADIMNKGTFPTVSQMGQRNRWVPKTVVRTTMANNQQMVSGKTLEIIDVIESRGRVERSWLIRGKGDLIIRAGSESTGFREITISL